MLADAGHIQETFDRVAPGFDTVLERNPINAWMHRVNTEILRTTFHPGDRLLEMGCGTGTAAIDLARAGCMVFGFDISEGMVAEARRKVLGAGLHDRVVIVQGRSRDLLQVLERSPWRRFDGGYANFTLAYEPDLRGLAAALASVLRPGAFFVCTLPNRIVLSEVLLYGSQLRFRQVLSRLAVPLLKDVHGSKVEIHAYSPAAVRDAFAESFQPASLRGIPTFLPPVYLHLQYRRLGGGQKFLQGLDARFAASFPWNRLGEHTLFVFRRR